MIRSSSMVRMLLAAVSPLLIFALVGQAAAQTCISPSYGLVSWWDGDTMYGITALDIWDGNDATLVNGASTVPGFVRDGFSFDGVNDRAEISDAPNLRPQQFTLDAWVNLDTANQLGCIICKQFGSSFLNSYALFVEAGELRSMISTNVSDTVQIIGPTVPVGTFFHAATTWDGAVLKLYLDGTLVALSKVAGGTIQYDSNPVLLGADDQDLNNFAIFLGGIIDEAELFDRALLASEIQANAGSAGTSCRYLLLRTRLGRDR